MKKILVIIICIYNTSKWEMKKCEEIHNKDVKLAIEEKLNQLIAQCTC